MGKYQDWYDSLPESTKIYLRNQPVWHDRDMWKAGLVGFAFGIILGLIL